MAKQIGLQPITLTKIENADRLKLTAEHKDRIASLFGVHPSSFDGDDAPILDLFGSPYTKDSLQRWRKAQSRLNELDATNLGVFTSAWMGALFNAAMRTSRFIEAKMSFDRWMSETIAHLNIGKEFRNSARLLTKVPRNYVTTVSRIYSDGLYVRRYEFPEESRWAPNTKVVITAERWFEQSQDPVGAVPGTPGFADSVDYSRIECFEEGTVTVGGKDRWTYMVADYLNWGYSLDDKPRHEYQSEAGEGPMSPLFEKFFWMFDIAPDAIPSEELKQRRQAEQRFQDKPERQKTMRPQGKK